ncbi:thioesterase domain-containing protein, partial [uncultured Chitinophaga sp.]|uniref:thioesterase domain-containing protein n=1 Tax=uncultured Chitinophaga sp. TaxID=339340 RepID=UPI0026273CC8
IWQEILGKDRISVKDNFFDIGGHSLKAVKLQHLLNSIHGFNVKLQDIYQRPTVEELALEQTADSKLFALNKPQRDDLKPVYFIPPVLGNAILYGPLAERLSDSFSCYGWQYRGLENEEPLYDSIELAARDCYDQIIAHPTKGERIILGYSMGAVIAYEVARLLETQEEPFRLVLVDRHVQAAPVYYSEATNSIHTAQLLNKYRVLLAGEHTGEERLAGFLSNNLKILAAYASGSSIKSNIYAIEATGTENRTRMSEWSQYTEGTVNVSFIEGDHWELFSRKHLTAMEKILRSLIIH